MRLSHLVIVLILLSPACVDVNNIPAEPSEPSSPPTPLNLGGIWSHAASYSDPTIHAICTSSGIIDWIQTGTALNGNYDMTAVCSDSTGSVTSHSSGSLEGQLDGSQLTFTTDLGCFYRGTVTDTTGAFVQGDGSCNFVMHGTPTVFYGTWQAARSSSCGLPVIIMRRETEGLCVGI